MEDGDRLKSESTFVSCVHDGIKWSVQFLISLLSSYSREGILWSAIRKEKRLKDLQKLDEGSGISVVIMSFDSMSHLTFRLHTFLIFEIVNRTFKFQTQASKNSRSSREDDGLCYSEWYV